MDYAEFDALMINAIKEKWIFVGAIFLLLLIAFAIYFFKKRKTWKTDNGVLGFAIVIAVVTGTMLLIVIDDTLVRMRDVNDHNYAELHGEYYRTTNYQENGMGSEHFPVEITAEDGVTWSLRLPGITHGEPEMFPYGTYEGTVWYAVESRCIVKFVPDEPIA